MKCQTMFAGKQNDNYNAQSMACHHKIPMLCANVTNSVMDGLALAHAYHEGKSFTVKP